MKCASQTNMPTCPKQEFPTPLSDRWQRCAWQQACGIVQSWYSNERENPHRSCTMFASRPTPMWWSSSLPNTPHFDFWLRISTLEAGHPVRIPITLYDRAKETLAQFPKLCSGVTLNRRDGRMVCHFRRGTQRPKSHNRHRWLGWTSAWSRSSPLRKASVMVRSAPNCAAGWNAPTQNAAASRSSTPA